jgi:hypothetical protein
VTNTKRFIYDASIFRLMPSKGVKKRKVELHRKRSIIHTAILLTAFVGMSTVVPYSTPNSLSVVHGDNSYATRIASLKARGITTLYERKVLNAESITLEQAISNPALRQKHLDGVATSNPSPYVSGMYYDEDGSHTFAYLDSLFKVGFFDQETVTRLKKEIGKSSLIQADSHSRMHMVFIPGLLGSGIKQPIFVGTQNYSGRNLPEGFPADLNKGFISDLDHERAHAADLYSGMDLGDGEVLNYEYAFELTSSQWGILSEIRAEYVRAQKWVQRGGGDENATLTGVVLYLSDICPKFDDGIMTETAKIVSIYKGEICKLLVPSMYK